MTRLIGESFTNQVLSNTLEQNKNIVLRKKIFIINLEAEVKILKDQKKSLLLKIKNKKSEILEEKRVLEDWRKETKKQEKLQDEKVKHYFKHLLWKEYKENEKQNLHTENFHLLATHFGTEKQLKRVEEIMGHQKTKGYITETQSNWMYKTLNKHYSKLEKN